MTYDEKIAVIQAAKEGKQIQVRNNAGTEWKDIICPAFNFECNYYRIKPESTYRPFKDAYEAFAEAKKHGFWLRNKNNCKDFIYHFGHGNCRLAEAHFDYCELLSNFVWDDTGEPCGILVE